MHVDSRAAFDHARHALWQAHRHDAALSRRLCALLDGVIKALWEARLGKSKATLWALGSHGREEMCWHSDLDLLILVPQEVLGEQVEEGVTLFLGDLGAAVDLQVTLATRTIAQQTALLLEGDWRVPLSLLDARPLAGHGLGVDPKAMALGHLAGCPGAAPALCQALREDLLRRLERLETPAARLEPDLKHAPGTWRAAQVLGHLGALGLEEVSAKEAHDIAQAKAWLMRLRHHLHWHHGKQMDRLRMEDQRRLDALFYPQPGAQRSGVMHDFTVHSRRLLRLVQRSLWGGGGGGGPRSLAQAFASLGPHRPTLSVEEQRRLEGGEALGAKACHDLLFCTETELEADMELLNLGVLVGHLPEFAPLVAHVQRDTYHIYPTDEHSLRCLNAARDLCRGRQESPPCEPKLWRHFCQMAAALPQPHLLLIAALLHDVGKNQGGDHSRRGAQKVAGVFERWPWYGAEEQEEVRALVEDHLLLSNASRRRDISDPALLGELVARIGGPRRLDLLVLLTVCDMGSVSPEALNSWRTALLYELHRNLRQRMETEAIQAWALAEPALKSRRHELFEALRAGQLKVGPGQLDAFLQDLPASHLLETRLAALCKQFSIYQQALACGQAQVHVDAQAELGASEVLVMVPDRPGLLVTLARAFSKEQLEILSAEITTTASGWALDTFRIAPQTFSLLEDATPRLTPRRAAQVEGLLLRALTPPSEPLLPPQSLGLRPEQVQVAVSRPAPGTCILEVRAPDTPGLLYRIVWALHAEGIGIKFSKLDRVGDQVVDNFYLVVPDDATLIESAVSRLTQTLYRALTSDP